MRLVVWLSGSLYMKARACVRESENERIGWIRPLKCNTSWRLTCATLAQCARYTHHLFVFMCDLTADCAATVVITTNARELKHSKRRRHGVTSIGAIPKIEKTKNKKNWNQMAYSWSWYSGADVQVRRWGACVGNRRLLCTAMEEDGAGGRGTVEWIASWWILKVVGW